MATGARRLKATTFGRRDRLIRPIRLLSIVGTRPEAIKIAPVALAAADRRDVRHHILATGQHGAPFDEALAAFGLAADERIEVATDPSPDVYADRLCDALASRLMLDPPEMVIVQGDTSSAYAGARAAVAAGVPLAHVEAGLRSGNLADPWPEERNRIAIDRLADLLFPPTRDAADKLRDEGCTKPRPVTGNTGIDALLWMRDRIAPSPPSATHRILLTCHRRESFGAGIARIAEAALRLVSRGDIAILCPLHTNPAVREPLEAMLGGRDGITLCKPLCYRAWVTAMASARLILTDSGGIQEEAPALGVPTLVLREVTERPEGMATGNLLLVGTGIDAIVATAARLLDDPAAHEAMARPAYPFGDGRAATRILDHIEQYFVSSPMRDRPLPSRRPSP